MNHVLAIAKALSDAGRLRAVMSLAEGELCLCQIIDLLGLSPSTVSRHMTILQQAGLVTCRKQGRWHYYRLAGRSAGPHVRQALRWVMGALQDDPLIAADARAVRRLRRRKPEDLTGCYSGS